MFSRFLTGATGAAMALIANPALADSPIGASATMTSAAGIYTYNVSFTSDLCCGTVIYKLGVLVNGAISQDSPADWAPNGGQNNLVFGGSDKNYNNSWQVTGFPAGGIESGQTVGGFTVISNKSLESIDWFAFGVFGNYTGGGNFYNSDNPGFEGTIALRPSGDNTSAAVPEAASWALMLVGFGGIGAALRRRDRTSIGFS